MRRGVCELCSAVVLAAGPALCLAQAPPEFEVSIKSVSFGARRDFLLPRGYSNWSDSTGTEIRPQFSIRPLVGRPILGAEPRLRLTSLTDQTGRNLLAQGARVLVGDAYSRERPRFLFCRSADGFEPTGTYPEALRPDALTIAMRSLPSALRRVEGEISVEVVEEDDTRVLALGEAKIDREIAPGVRLQVDPKGGWNGKTIISYAIGPAAEGHSRPVLNMLRYDCGTMEDIVPLKPAREIDGIARGRAEFDIVGRDYCSPTLFAHLVYRTRTVTMPFRLEHVPITGFTPPSRVLRQSRLPELLDLAAVEDGYEVRLVRLMASGGQRTDGSASARQASVMMRLGVLDKTDARSFGRFIACRIDEMTDQFGRPTGKPREMRTDDGRGTGGGQRFMPLPALPSSGNDYTERGRAHMILVTIPFADIPPRLGKLRGSVEFAEVTRDVVREVELRPAAEPVELAPGARLIVREPVNMPGVLPPQPPSNWVELQLDLPPGAPRDLGESGGPRLNMFQLIGADGKAAAPEWSYGGARQGDRIVYSLGQTAFLGKAASVRLHVVLQTRVRRLPFEFEDVPCAEW